MPPPRKKMFDEMGEYADEERSAELKSKYGPPPEPEVQPVPGTEEDDMAMEGEGMPPMEGMEGGEGAAQSIEEMLASMSPEEIEQLLATME